MGRKTLAIFAGLAVDIGLTLVLEVSLGIALTIYLGAQGMSPHEIAAKMDAKHVQQSTGIMLASMGLGAFGSLAGGFITGWLAREARVTCGAIMGVLSCLFGALFWSENLLWYNCLGIVTTLAMTTGGGALSQAIFGRGAPPPPATLIGPVA